MIKKISIPLVQLNNKYGDQVYLPYSVAVLKAFVLKTKTVQDNFQLFYEEVNKVLTTFFPKISKDFLDDLIKYQKKIVAHYNDSKESTIKLKYNIHEYFNGLREGKLTRFEKGNFTYSFTPKKGYSKQKKLFSREVVWFGRKGGKFFHSVSKLNN